MLPEGWAVRNANQFAEAALAIAAHPQRLARLLVIALAAHLINLSSLHAVFLLSGIFALGCGVGPLFFVADNVWLTTDPRRQCLHDKAARTLVVRTAPPGRGPAQAS